MENSALFRRYFRRIRRKLTVSLLFGNDPICQSRWAGGRARVRLSIHDYRINAISVLRTEMFGHLPLTVNFLFPLAILFGYSRIG